MYKDEAIAALKKVVAESEKKYDTESIDRAVAMACEAHEGQMRYAGGDYVCHPLQVACILIELGMDNETIVAAILHDVVEDTGVELDDIKRQFGADVALLVDGVTKITQMPFSTREEEQAENVRKMLMAMSQDIRVIIIKLADRLHNMRTNSGWHPQKRRDKAKETLDIYAPIAHRLGIRAIKEELEDISLHLLDPMGCEEIEQNLSMRSDERAEFLEAIQGQLRERLDEYGMKPYVSGRIKSIAGIYRKMYMQGRSFDEIYDVYAVRIIVDTVNDCYNVLGIVHDLFHPIPNRFKDYISTPKTNMYQSLHTTVISHEKIAFEVQIRTWEMHHTAEYGIAAHWKYKLGIHKKDRLEDKVAWVRQFIENQKDVDDAEDIVRSIKTDLSSDDVFVFSPRGRVVSLPRGSTVIDFAYAIHSEVGNRMVGAKVDGRIVSIDYQVNTGEVVEILTTSAPNHGPSRDWLQLVKTSEARNKIRSWYKRERRDENVQQGREELEREMARNFIRLSGRDLEEFLSAQAKRQHCDSIDDFYAAIGYGGILLSRLIPRMKEDAAKYARSEPVTAESIVAAAKPHRHHNGGVIIESMDNCLVKFARCCNPVPGDEIIGFITRGYGVSIHKRDCTNVPTDPSHSAEPERWVNVSWEDSIREEFKAELHIFVADRIELLADITAQLAAMHVMIYGMQARASDTGRGEIFITVGVNSVQHLQEVMNRLGRINGIEDIKRGGA
ncbi:MAG: bifunctional (p)ppGpp synthetase/guanosine-3',5'-bis(diphosphate) 3'-pyrophosphohydrolase [Clostridia bacterium]|nr:bifunctional (p)ppGpp synthetase/guanosine-3',5'-bis(diphosphate) 3'-pyrophosphohydrolase [Clostridia bacterium]